MGKRLDNPNKTFTIPNMFHETLERCKYIENNSSLQGNIRYQLYDYYRRRGNSPNFILLPRLSEWAALSSVPFSKLRKGLLTYLSVFSLQNKMR